MQAIACLILFTFANVLSTLLAKIMASHFHKATYFHKMQEAIRKVPLSPGALHASGMSHAHNGHCRGLCVVGLMYVRWAMAEQQCQPTGVLIL